MAVRWERQEDQLILSVDIPANTTATILLPGAWKILDRSGLDFEEAGNQFKAHTGSGRYKILCQMDEFA